MRKTEKQRRGKRCFPPKAAAEKEKQYGCRHAQQNGRRDFVINHGGKVRPVVPDELILCREQQRKRPDIDKLTVALVRQVGRVHDIVQPRLLVQPSVGNGKAFEQIRRGIVAPIERRAAQTGGGGECDGERERKAQPAVRRSDGAGFSFQPMHSVIPPAFRRGRDRRGSHTAA